MNTRRFTGDMADQIDADREELIRLREIKADYEKKLTEMDYTIGQLMKNNANLQAALEARDKALAECREVERIARRFS